MIRRQGELSFGGRSHHLVQNEMGLFQVEHDVQLTHILEISIEGLNLSRTSMGQKRDTAAAATVIERRSYAMESSQVQVKEFFSSPGRG